jgi:putative flippase GtrA
MVKFVFVGAANTAVTASVFLLLTYRVSAQTAFTIAYLFGLAFVLLVTPRFVFSVRPTRSRRVGLAAVYVGTYVLGLATTRLLAGVTSQRLFLVGFTVMVTASVSFIGARLTLIGWRAKSKGIR